MSEHPSRPFVGPADAADVAIDRAVREIMSGEPRPGFRQRVLARLDEHPRAAWNWPRLGFAAGVAAIVLMVAMWARTENPIRPSVTVPQQAASLPQPAPPAPVAAPREAAPPAIVRQERRAMARSAAPPSADRRVSAASVSTAEESLEAGPPPVNTAVDPAPISPLQIRPLETPELIVRPLVVGPIVVVQLPPPR